MTRKIGVNVSDASWPIGTRMYFIRRIPDGWKEETVMADTKKPSTKAGAGSGVGRLQKIGKKPPGGKK